MNLLGTILRPRRLGVAALAAFAALPALSAFAVDTTPPAITLDTPAYRTADTTPQFSGTCGTAPGDSNSVTVEVYEGTSISGSPVRLLTTTCGLDSTYAVSLSPARSQGTYTARASQVDDANNTGDSVRTFTIDTTAPFVALDTPTGLATSTPSFSGSGGTATGDSPTVTIRIYDHVDCSNPSKIEEELSAPVDPATGAVSATSAGLTDGNHVVCATQSDDVGNTGTTVPVSFTISTNLPAPTLTSPANGTVTNDATPSFGGVAGTEPGDSKDLVTVYVFHGAPGDPTDCSSFASDLGFVATATADPLDNGNFSGATIANEDALADGDYTAVACQEDTTLHLFGAGPLVGFSVDTVTPAPALTTPTDGSYTTDFTPDVAGVCGTAPGDAGSVTTEIYPGGSISGFPDRSLTLPCSDGAFAGAIFPALSDGVYTARILQDDAAGNTGIGGPVTFTVDTTAPTITLSSPAATSFTTAMPAIAGTAGTDAGDLDIAVELFHQSSTSGLPAAVCAADIATSTADVKFTIAKVASYSGQPPSPLAEGDWVVRVAQCDQVGQESTAGPRLFTVDAVAPQPILDPVPGYLTTATPSFTGVVDNGANDLAAATIQIFAGDSTSGTPIEKDVGVAPNYTFSVTADPLDDGQYTARVVQYDEAGNRGSSAPQTFLVDTQPPAITLAMPADGSFTNDSTPEFAGVAGLADGDDAGVTVRVFAGGGASCAAGSPVLALDSTRNPGDGSFAVSPVALLPDGDYTARACQSDVGGNLGASAPNSFRVDTHAPAPTLTAPAPGATLTTATPAFEGIAEAAPSPDAATVVVEVYVGTSVSGSPARSLAVTGTDPGAYSVAPAPALDNGIYTARTRQQDRAGNVGYSAPVTFTVAATSPPPSDEVPGEPAGSGQPPGGDVLPAPVVTGLRQSHARWRVGSRLPRVARRLRAPVGTTFAFTLNVEADVRFAFARQLAGRREGSRCVAPRPRNRRKRACTRTVAAGAFSLTAHAGKTKLLFEGRLSRSKRLAPGRYRLVITARDASGRSSAARALRFTVVR